MFYDKFKHVNCAIIDQVNDHSLLKGSQGCLETAKHVCIKVNNLFQFHIVTFTETFNARPKFASAVQLKVGDYYFEHLLKIKSLFVYPTEMSRLHTSNQIRFILTPHFSKR